MKSPAGLGSAGKRRGGGNHRTLVAGAGQAKRHGAAGRSLGPNRKTGGYGQGGDFPGNEKTSTKPGQLPNHGPGPQTLGWWPGGPAAGGDNRGSSQLTGG